MAFVAEVTVPPAAVSFGRVLDRHDDLTLELDRVVPTQHGRMPFVIVRADDRYDRIEGDIRADPTVRRLESIERFEDGRLYRIERNGTVGAFARAIVESGATVTSGVGAGEAWSFELRFRDQGRVEQFQARTRENDVDLELDRLRTTLEVDPASRYDLTEKQYETLVTAVESGFFETPRQATLAELGDELDVSKAAVTGRLRRGLTNLLSQTVVQCAERGA
ncbi:helix-turn-helix domain-containing protein [Halosolutus amylolyticus]|uniref:Helix-turn-helix domain-containing protein n=1 Tax=Halosolutus amylolyticus TaxID=2932267 RepID=A0ABD5PKS1_9EURY|nr:helix-turn-helix domain-containing protein [Halosolutus amylolyticus]